MISDDEEKEIKIAYWKVYWRKRGFEYLDEAIKKWVEDNDMTDEMIEHTGHEPPTAELLHRYHKSNPNKMLMFVSRLVNGRVERYGCWGKDLDECTAMCKAWANERDSTPSKA